MIDQSDVNEMQRAVNAIRAENRRLQGEIDSMCSTLRGALNEVKGARSTAMSALESGEDTLNKDDNTLKNVSKVADDIRAKMILYKNVENAYKTIRQLTEELNSSLGNEKIVRRMVTAIIDNEEKTFASEETIQTESEKLYLNTQYFFLSHVMMDLQLRKRGETSAADRARKKALELDNRKSCWVYFMVALRREDKKEINYWLEKITARPLNGSEKDQLKVLTLLSLRDESEEAKKIRAYIGLDEIQSIDKDEIVKTILSQYRAAMVVTPPKFKYLSKYVKESDDLNEALTGAMNNEEVGAFVQKISQSGEDKMRKDIISKMFDSVIETCNSPKAKKIQADIAYQEKIIAAKGVIEEAMALKAQEDVTNVSDINVEACLFEWLNEKERYNGKRELNEFSYVKFKPSYKRAYKEYVLQYRRKCASSVTVDLGGYSTRSSLNSREEEAANIKAYCERQCAATKATVKNTKFILCMIFGGLLLVAGIVMKFLSSVITNGGSIAALIIGAVAGIALLVLGLKIKYKNYRTLIEADKKKERDIAVYTELMNFVITDMQSFHELYKQYDDKMLPDSFF